MARPEQGEEEQEGVVVAGELDRQRCQAEPEDRRDPVRLASRNTDEEREPGADDSGYGASGECVRASIQSTAGRARFSSCSMRSRLSPE